MKNKELIFARIKLLDDNCDLGERICCPVCEFDYTHFGVPVVEHSQDSYKAPSWAGRGNAIVIPCWSECGSKWDLVIGFHKGNTYTHCNINKYCELPESAFESPIEYQLYKSLSFRSELEVQFEIGRYRADLAYPDIKLAIECDGHDYHKTKEQRTYDAQRDRYFKSEGWEVLRFTGSEIYKDAGACAREVYEAYKRLSENLQPA